MVIYIVPNLKIDENCKIAMGRFKIYDPKQLVMVLSDSNYGKCLLCEKTLKNIMGNIKRHYRQMHSVNVNANINRPNKNRKRSSKRTTNDCDYKMAMKTSSKEKNQNNNAIAEADETGRIGTDISTLTKTETVGNLQLCDKDPKYKLLNQELPINCSNNSCNEKEFQMNPYMLYLKDKNKAENASKAYVEYEGSTQKSNIQKNKLDEENDGVQVPCHSHISSIQISSLDSCSKVQFLKCLVETKTEMNIPLKNFEKGVTFEKALQHWNQHYQFNYSSQTIGEHIDRMAKKLRQEITKMVSDKIIHLKLDIIRGNKSNVMLVNIQFIKDFEIKVATLNAIEFLDDDTATYLKSVLTTLERYQIDINRVYSAIKDNTKNFQQYIKYSEGGIQFCETNDSYESPSTNEYCRYLNEQFPAHALHFAACDIIQKLNENISQSRDAAKKLRLHLAKLNIKDILLIDNATSWQSVYDMIKSLHDMREIVESNNLSSVEVDWLFVTKFIEGFKPIVDTASMLHSSSLFAMGDFYREWLSCELELEELSASNELALYLLEALGRRKMDLFENNTFLAALYLDPRFCYMGSMYLNDKQKNIAISNLMQIFNKLDITSSEHTATNHYNLYSKLEKHTTDGLKAAMETMTNSETISMNNVDCQDVKDSLEQLQFGGRLSFDNNVLDYWKIAKYKHPILSKIAEVALAAPATQATINRALNTSSITLMNNSKFYESTDVIENLLLLRLNQDIVDKIKL